MPQPDVDLAITLLKEGRDALKDVQTDVHKNLLGKLNNVESYIGHAIAALKGEPQYGIGDS